ncbi:acetylornithine deacetylase [Methylobacterium platani]|uniref:Acetylornithine deacetylase n=2 Tax=Methylobacterium platani TaxID=427683 RepID=A0A179SK02_9HYPH|nr:acetylornithine deacetylase [Methylobacterium platani]KMO18773.1 acetylornithine deacetylase [Methylobacterium platani JCM 14648]OAS27785.1 acetylornithine deacetylase [Methylobacterium platani]
MTSSDSQSAAIQDLLATLVAFETVSSATNLPLVDFVEDHARRHGATVERVVDGTGEKAALWITIGPADRPGYVLSGHSDVVPVEGQDWTHPPFRLTEIDGRLYGRGTSDMKGFLAVCLALLPEMAAAPLTRPLHLAVSYDEEVGCLGVRPLIAHMRERGVRPLGCFVGEPTGMDVVIGHKGKYGAKVTFRGRACHSALAPTGVNAIEYAARFIERVRVTAEGLARDGTRDDLYDVPHTTGLTALVQGGTALNIVPDRCTVGFEFRAIAADDPRALAGTVLAYAEDVLVPEMRARDPACGIAVEPVIDYPGLDVAPDAPLVTLAKRLAGRNGHAKVSYGTEAGLFQSLGDVPSVVIGPGDIARAHKADEYVEARELADCAGFVRRLIAESCA